jgi:hypothetical protein
MTGYEATKAIRACEAERRQAYNLQQTSWASSPLYSPMLSPTAHLSTSFPFNVPSPLSSKNTRQTQSIAFHLNAPEIPLNIPTLIIALTGFSSQEDQEQAFEAGVDVFMTKPVRFKEVGKILEGWMKSREKEILDDGSSTYSRRKWTEN